MTAETDAVIFTRRETWNKALAALVAYRRCCAENGDREIVQGAIAELCAAARSDGVSCLMVKE